MPNKKAAIKALKQDKKKHDRNSRALSEIRTLAKKARLLIKDNKKDEAIEAVRKYESKLDKAVKRHRIKKNNAARRVSRMRAACDKIGSTA